MYKAGIPRHAESSNTTGSVESRSAATVVSDHSVTLGGADLARARATAQLSSKSEDSIGHAA